MSRSLDNYYKTILTVYFDRNFYRSTDSMLSNFIEVIGALNRYCICAFGDRSHAGNARYASDAKAKAAESLVKSIAWWMTICGRLQIKSLDDLLWNKYPRRCPYCCEEECDPERKRDNVAFSPADLQEQALLGDAVRPRSLQEWRLLFRDIYGKRNRAENRSVESLLCWLTSAIGEFAQALRFFYVKPGWYWAVAPDIFAWLMAIANYIMQDKAFSDASLDSLFSQYYGGKCFHCDQPKCACTVVEDQLFNSGEEMPGDSIIHNLNILTFVRDIVKVAGGPEMLERLDDAFRMIAEGRSVE